MKETRKNTIPTREAITPAGYRFNFNHSAVEIDGETFYNADFVEVQDLQRHTIISALVKVKYSPDAEIALHRKFAAQEAEAEKEFQEYNQYVNWCKSIVDAPEPTIDWLKADIETWLKARQIKFTSSMNKTELLELCK